MPLRGCGTRGRRIHSVRQSLRGTWVHNRISREAGDTRGRSFAGLNGFLASKSTNRPMVIFCKSKGNVIPEDLLGPLTWKPCVIRTTEPVGTRMFAGVDKVLRPLAICLREQAGWCTGGVVELKHVLSLVGSQTSHASRTDGVSISMGMSFTGEGTASEGAKVAMLADSHGTEKHLLLVE